VKNLKESGSSREAFRRDQGVISSPCCSLHSRREASI
jgi:hypothetical protein